MPNYGTLPSTGAGSGVAATVLSPGDQEYLFNDESPAAPQLSIAISRSSGPTGVPSSIVFSIKAAGGTVLILGANVDNAAEWALAEGNPLYTSTNQAYDYYDDIGNFNFYCCQLSAGAGPVTVIAQR